MYSFGYVGVIGKTNAGKSSLVNALVGQKVAIVTNRPQTTRDNILGVLNGENYQVVLVDTPGVHRSKNKLDKKMMKNVRSAISGVDLILYLADGTKALDEEEEEYYAHLPQPKVLVKTKIDKKGLKNFDADFEISSLNGSGLEDLKNYIIDKMPKSETKNFPFEEDDYTDKSLRFIVAEEIRQNALNILEDEIPHGIAVEIERFEEKENLTIIEAVLVVEEERHKGIVIGKGGKTLKIIGQKAREFAEELLGSKVLLKIFVKVDKDWRNSDNSLKKFGY